MGWACECNLPGCKLEIDDNIWEKARTSPEIGDRNYRSIINPDCPNLKYYKVIFRTPRYVIVEYTNHRILDNDS